MSVWTTDVEVNKDWLDSGETICNGCGKPLRHATSRHTLDMCLEQLRQRIKTLEQMILPRHMPRADATGEP